MPLGNPKRRRETEAPEGEQKELVKRALKEPEVLTLIRQRYEEPAFVVLSHVRSRTGAGDARTADALAMGTWRSRGMALHGFEIKSSRGDWLRELKAPEKADEIARFCHYWWVVTGAKGIVKRGELPPTWGLLEPNDDGTKLVQVVDAPHNDADKIELSFLASLFRNVIDDSRNPQAVQEILQVKSVEWEERGWQKAKWRVEEAEAKLKRNNERIAEFERLSGISIDGWDMQNVADAVRMIRNAHLPHLNTELKSLKDHAQRILDGTNAALESCKNIVPPAPPPAVTPLTWENLEVVARGFSRITQDEFAEALKQAIGATRDYADGCYGRFQDSPLGYCLTRSSDQQGRVLLALALKKGAEP